MFIQEAIQVALLIVVTILGCQAYNSLRIGVFRTSGLTDFIFNVTGALIIAWLVVHGARTILGLFGFVLPGPWKFLPELAMTATVFVFAVWIWYTREKASWERVSRAFIGPLIGVVLFEGAASFGLLKQGFIGAIRALRHL